MTSFPFTWSSKVYQNVVFHHLPPATVFDILEAGSPPVPPKASRRRCGAAPPNAELFGALFFANGLARAAVGAAVGAATDCAAATFEGSGVSCDGAGVEAGDESGDEAGVPAGFDGTEAVDGGCGGVASCDTCAAFSASPGEKRGRIACGRVVLGTVCGAALATACWVPASWR